MIISTHRIDHPRGAAAFSLTEVIVAASLSLFVLAGVLSAFVMIGRTGYLAGNYSELEAETRRGLDAFGADARRALDLQWNNSQSVTFTLPTAGVGITLVTYGYDTDATSATYRCFFRQLGDASSSAPRTALVHRVATDFAFQRFKLEQAGVADNTAANDLETKQLQVTFRATRTGPGAPSANESAQSACYVLRNKRVSN